MGVYDIFGDHKVQLKNGECTMHYYKVGDHVPLNDGIYVGYGYVVIKDEISVQRDQHLLGELIDALIHLPRDADVVLERWLKYNEDGRLVEVYYH